MLTCIARVSKLKKNSRTKTKITLFFAFLVNSNPIFPLKAMGCNTSPSNQFFLVTFFIFVSHHNHLLPWCFFLWNGNQFKDLLQIQILFHFENWCFNLSLSVPPFNSPPFHALGKAKYAHLLATTL